MEDKVSPEENSENRADIQSQWRLVWLQFKSHRLALVGLIILFIFYFIGALFPEFFAPYGKLKRFDECYFPPQKIHFFDEEGKFHIQPFVYGYKAEVDFETWSREYTVDKSKRYKINLFTHGKEYKILGLFNTDIHLFGTKQGGHIFLFGTDDLGRDVFSRTLYAMRISLSIGFAGVFLSLILGLIFGGISGLLGGTVDEIIQRLIETLIAIPKVPLWMGLAAAVPKTWSVIRIYFALTIILSLMSWTGLARVIRSKFISLREEDFVIAARGFNASMATIIGRHLIPNFITYVIVHLTLAIPMMIIAETSLSFLGLGLRPPVVSLGVLLQRAQRFQTVSIYPWLLIPGFFVIIVVIAYNFVGDGLRDAADPYQN